MRMVVVLRHRSDPKANNLSCAYVETDVVQHKLFPIFTQTGNLNGHKED